MFVFSVAIVTEKTNIYLILMSDECIYLLDSTAGGIVTVEEGDWQHSTNSSSFCHALEADQRGIARPGCEHGGRPDHRNSDLVAEMEDLTRRHPHRHVRAEGVRGSVVEH